MAGDWIKLHRKIRNSAVWSDPTTAFIWVTLLLEANFEERQLLNGDTVKRGELIIGQQQFATKYNLTRKVVRTALKRLEVCGNIVTKGASNGTHITICNYETYQTKKQEAGQPGANQGPARGQPGANEGPTRGHRIRTKELKKGRTKEELEANASVSKADGRITPEELFERWNRFVEDKKKLKKVVKLTDKLKTQIRARCRDAEWWPSMQAAVKMLPLFGDGWQPDLHWLVKNDSNVYRLLEGAFDFRVDSESGRKLMEQRRRNAANEREKQIVSEKRKCTEEAVGTRKAMDATLRQMNGGDEESNGKSLLFG